MRTIEVNLPQSSNCERRFVDFCCSEEIKLGERVILVDRRSNRAVEGRVSEARQNHNFVLDTSPA
jgi:hypothetical protein